LRWAERNIALNEVSNSIRLSSRSLPDIDERFTLVAANLILDTLLELMPSFYGAIEEGGRLILSGLLEGQTGEVRQALAGAGFIEVKVLQEQEWVCVISRRVE
jgi:ribosomal protein L11 methylase PrmA